MQSCSDTNVRMRVHIPCSRKTWCVCSRASAAAANRWMLAACRVCHTFRAGSRRRAATTPSAPWWCRPASRRGPRSVAGQPSSRRPTRSCLHARPRCAHACARMCVCALCMGRRRPCTDAHPGACRGVHVGVGVGVGGFAHVCFSV